MENIVAICLIVAAVLIGGLFGASTFPVEKQIPVPGQTQIVYVNQTVPVDKIVNQTIYQPAELQNKAVSDFLVQYQKDDNAVCNGNSYDVDKVSVRKTDKQFTIDVTNSTVYDVQVSGQLKFMDKDVQDTRCLDNFAATVSYDNGDISVSY